MFVSLKKSRHVITRESIICALRHSRPQIKIIDYSSYLYRFSYIKEKYAQDNFQAIYSTGYQIII